MLQTDKSKMEKGITSGNKIGSHPSSDAVDMHY